MLFSSNNYRVGTAADVSTQSLRLLPPERFSNHPLALPSRVSDEILGTQSRESRRTSSLCVVPGYLPEALPENLSEMSSDDPFGYLRRHFAITIYLIQRVLELTTGSLLSSIALRVEATKKSSLDLLIRVWSFFLMILFRTLLLGVPIDVKTILIGFPG
ncbi:hypothetical protein Tco_0755102 [Tanacetum coccineum]